MKEIIKRTYYSIDVEVNSPINISSGESEITDADVIKDGDGRFFVPGSSLAGAFRNYAGKEKETDCIFGYSKGEEGRMSSIFVSDLCFSDKEDLKKTVRNRVALTETKGVDNKFDMEIIEPGIKGELKLEIVERQGDVYNTSIVPIIYGIESGEIRIGACKNRGFGKLRITGIKERSFDKSNREEWIKFCAGEISFETENGVEKVSTYEEWIQGKGKNISQYVKVSVPLLLDGGISIRRYSTKPGKADYEHVTYEKTKINDKPIPVIPGMSWNGAIRAEANNILKQLGCSYEQRTNLINDWFGFVSVKKSDAMDEPEDERKETAKQSLIVIRESIIKESKPLPMSRNKINRFTAGTVETALYSEVAYFGGNTTLEYLIKKDEERRYKALIGLMSLITKEIANGYVAVGGQVGIGRGIFKENGSVGYSEDVKEAGMKDLYSLLFEEGKHE